MLLTMVKKQLIVYVVVGSLIASCRNFNSVSVNPDEREHYKSFQLSYVSAGWGGNVGHMGPVFKVNGTGFVYTNEQNSSYGRVYKIPDTLCIGEIQPWAIDSILYLVSNIKDSVVRRANYNIMSGSLEFISIKNDSVDFGFELYNANDTVALKVVNVLNTFIPDTLDKLYLAPWSDTLDDAYLKNLSK